MGLLTGRRRRARDRRGHRPQPAPLPRRCERDRNRIQPSHARASPGGSKLPRTFDLRVGDTQALEFPDASFDTVVRTLALYTIPDDRAAVSDARRVLRPEGRLVSLEHVRSPAAVIRFAQRVLEPRAVRLEGDHLLREPLDHVRAEGFESEQLLRSKLGIVERVAARKPA